jgi:hypothetical protein
MEIQAQVDLGNITCVSNDQLRSVMEKTTATPQQVQEALRAPFLKERVGDEKT